MDLESLSKAGRVAKEIKQEIDEAFERGDIQKVGGLYDSLYFSWYNILLEFGGFIRDTEEDLKKMRQEKKR